MADATSRSLFALLDEGSCFVGTLAELALAADRSYMLQVPDDSPQAPTFCLTEVNFGLYPMVNHQTRLLTRFCGVTAPVVAAREHMVEAGLRIESYQL